MNYSAKEERYNTYSHAIGVGFGIIAGAFLLQKAIASQNPWAIVSDIVFVISMVLMYLSSTLYHAEKIKKRKHSVASSTMQPSMYKLQEATRLLHWWYSAKMEAGAGRYLGLSGQQPFLEFL